MDLFEALFGIREVKHKKNTKGRNPGSTHHNVIKKNGDKMSWDTVGGNTVKGSLHTGGKGKKNKKIY